MTNEGRPSLEDVLDEFATEADTGRATLERYLVAFPAFANELVDLAREIARPVESFAGPLTDKDINTINAAWRHYEAAAPRQQVDPWATLTVDQLRQAARVLGVPRQVVTAFRERRVLASSVSDRFLKRFSTALGASAEALRDWMVPSMGELARSYKANEKPLEPVQVTLEQILMDAGVPPERRIDLMSDTD